MLKIELFNSVNISFMCQCYCDKFTYKHLHCVKRRHFIPMCNQSHKAHLSMKVIRIAS